MSKSLFSYLKPNSNEIYWKIMQGSIAESESESEELQNQFNKLNLLFNASH